jgi:hypothetical protein
MSYTSHDLLAAARRAIPEVSAEAVAARRTRGDEVVWFCRKFAFLRQNPKIGLWKINGLQTSTFLFSVI